MACVDCNKVLSGSNPCSSFKAHNCGNQQPLSKQPRGDSTDSIARAVLSSSAAADDRGPAGGQPKPGQIVPGVATRRCVMARLAMFFFATGTAYRRIKNVHLVAAFPFWASNSAARKPCAPQCWTMHTKRRSSRFQQWRPAMASSRSSQTDRRAATAVIPPSR
jgi:hypothetical protein